MLIRFLFNKESKYYLEDFRDVSFLDNISDDINT
jgi:hypothetical protein